MQAAEAPEPPEAPPALLFAADSLPASSNEEPAGAPQVPAASSSGREAGEQRGWQTEAEKKRLKIEAVKRATEAARAQDQPQGNVEADHGAPSPARRASNVPKHGQQMLGIGPGAAEPLNQNGGRRHSTGQIGQGEHRPFVKEASSPNDGGKDPQASSLSSSSSSESEEEPATDKKLEKRRAFSMGNAENARPSINWRRISSTRRRSSTASLRPLDLGLWGKRQTEPASQFSHQGSKSDDDAMQNPSGASLAAWGVRNEVFQSPLPMPIEEQLAGLPPPTLLQEVQSWSRALSDSWRFNLLTTILTVYALIGDDFRLFATAKQTDVLFNALSLLSIAVFSGEIIVFSLGKADYFLGFFFCLDVVSTVTLLFDLTWVANEWYCKTNDQQISWQISTGNLESTLRQLADARASRTVRILRLVRLGKLYKIYRSILEYLDTMDNVQASPGSVLKELWDEYAGTPARLSTSSKKSDVGSDDGNASSMQSGSRERQPWHTQSQDASKSQRASGTRVGKKLSDMITRRVIVLVLVMMFSSSLFLPETMGFEEFQLSGTVGAELIYQRWRSWCPVEDSQLPWCLQSTDGKAVDLQETQQLRAWYETYLLTFLYGHLGGDFAWRLFWIGLGSQTAQAQHNDTAAAFIGHLAQLNQARFLGSSALPEDELWRWDVQFSHRTWASPVQEMAEQVKKRLVAAWREECLGFFGVPLGVGNGAQMSTGCSISEELRCNEVQYHSPLTRTKQEQRHINMLFAFDIRSSSQREAGLNLLQTVFICCAVGVGAMSFAKDVNTVLLTPIERIVAKMEVIKDHPLAAIRLGDIEYRRELAEIEHRKQVVAQMGKCRRWMYKARGKNLYHLHHDELLETLILERTLIKLGGLLALGFGEAGAEIIGQNMQGGATAFVNAMVPGQIVDAIFGFCSIRDFSDATEVLKEKVMVFVNQVSEIVHGCADDYHGSPNKIIGGNSFLIVWRLRDADDFLRTKMADMAVVSFVRIAIEIQKSRVLATYRQHPGLQQRVHQYRVLLGFGMHCGWAIEGAIGSKFKIDASYLSPTLNVASCLEEATNRLGTWVLVSHFIVNLLSQDMAAYLRNVDHVTVPGHKMPIRLFTLDLDHTKVAVKMKVGGATRVYNRFKIRQIRETLKAETLAEDFQVAGYLSSDPDFAAMRSSYSDEFFQRFSVGFKNYEAGEWRVARDLFRTCHFSPEKCLGDEMLEDELPIDGPTRALLTYMKQASKDTYWPPGDWNGHHALADDVLYERTIL
eukprot:TRINITY_DN33835_c0_g1_i1.p1 TRINITY_DN33835_c0_g1~~TRINITY_DN33835_c0_g1_i1.p1  ORF type:complete len:1254 (-),score=233.37 TRINITY_DN33835_c0_g1_i1:36-3797(-)